MKSLSPAWLFVTPWTVAHQAPQSMEFLRQECWSGLPFPSPGANKELNYTYIILERKIPIMNHSLCCEQQGSLFCWSIRCLCMWRRRRWEHGWTGQGDAGRVCGQSCLLYNVHQPVHGEMIGDRYRKMMMTDRQTEYWRFTALTFKTSYWRSYPSLCNEIKGESESEVWLLPHHLVMI